MKLTLSGIRKGVVFLIFLLLAGAAGYALGQGRIFSLQLAGTPAVKIDKGTPLVRREKEADLSLFWQVWEKLEQKHLDRKNLDRQKMVFGAISGMVSSLGDPYTVFLPPTENKEAKDDLRGDFEGVGIQIGYNKDQKLSVVAPLSGTPAEKAGLKAGDLILKITDEKAGVDKDTAGVSLPEAVRLIRGPKGTKVTLTIGREGSREPFAVDLKRETIVVKSVELSFKEKNQKTVAVIKLSRFGERTYEEWEEAVQQVQSSKFKVQSFGGVVLDLRNNPGGFLQGAVFIASEFMADGVVVQQDSGINGKNQLSVNRKGNLLSEPLAVLINNGSASSSEIVAGALQEAKRAKIVGEKTFGKGTVQEAEDLSGGAGLHITVSRWLLPSGASIDKTGVKPDFEVKNDEKDEAKDLQLEKAVEILTK